MLTLHTAIMKDRIRQIQLLVSVGINVNLQDKVGRSPLMMACFMRNFKRREAVCELLLEHGANLELLDKFNRTIIMYACATRNVPLLKKLLEYIDSDMNHADREGNTSLMYAAIEGDVRVLTMIMYQLKQYGLSLDVRNKRGFTAYLLALKHGNIECANILRENEASVNIFDLENFWDGEQWIKTHYVQRLRRESMQVERHRRTKSVAVQRFSDWDETTLIQRPKSIPPTFAFTTRDKDDRKTPKLKENAWTDDRYKKSTASRSNCKHSVDILKTALPEYPEDNDSVVTYSNISRPQTVSSLRSDALSLSGATDYAETVNSEMPRRAQSGLQRQELIKIFQQYSMCQVPVPPPIPKIAVRRRRFINKLRITEERKVDLPGSAANVNSPKNRRRSMMLPSRARTVKTEVKVLSAMRPEEKKSLI